VGIIWEPSKKAVLFQQLGSTEEKSTSTLMFKGCALGSYLQACYYGGLGLI